MTMAESRNFDFFSPTRILFGRGRFPELGSLAASFGRHALLVMGARSARKSGLLAKVQDLLGQTGVRGTVFHVSGEPEVETVNRAAELARAERCDLVIGIGGGSCLDTAKAAAVLATNTSTGGSALDHIEVIGKGRRFERPGLPVIAVPTTGGTGAEVTRNAVLGHAPSRRKASLRHEYLLPRVALVDPSLTDGLLPSLTAASGLDALTQLIEAYLSRGANPFSDALALDGIRRAARALPAAYRWASEGTRRDADPEPQEARDVQEAQDVQQARDDLSLAALESGLCLSSAGLGVIHGLSGPLGGRYPIPHGFACAALLPHAFRVNTRMIRQAGADSPMSRRLPVLAEALGIEPHTSLDLGLERTVGFLEELVLRLGVPRLREFDVAPADLPDLAREGLSSNSTRHNPVELSVKDLEETLAAAL